MSPLHITISQNEKSSNIYGFPRWLIDLYFWWKNEVLSAIRTFMIRVEDQCCCCGPIRLNFTSYSLTNYQATSVLKFWVQILFLTSLFLDFNFLWVILFTGFLTAEYIWGNWTTETVCRPESRCNSSLHSDNVWARTWPLASRSPPAGTTPAARSVDYISGLSTLLIVLPTTVLLMKSPALICERCNSVCRRRAAAQWTVRRWLRGSRRKLAR